ncbi:DUF4942 domain-containing protein [Marinobacter sp. SS13-12]|uniref:class I SAM-dependent methyltransferase n=1 Tax=Marinobacter sp. SS13-12 TaxID=3050451 RepID=UPI0025520FB9|nr:DUF4942 domain-containing protein [Marinobacter sp. SS13-12]MDK8465762.1 DUF4942 domain-containing protein [Marinobacter sp. SS13-12]
MSTLALVSALKDHSQDFEFYPTTDAMLNTIREDIQAILSAPFSHKYPIFSALDVGAGDGRALMRLTEGDRYAIEKSLMLVERQDRSVVTVGTDLFAQVLLDLRCDVIFSNPPYSHFGTWSEKIVREANAKLIYLVVPVRWQTDPALQSAIESRKAETEVLAQYSFDTPDAARRARTTVDVVRIRLDKHGRDRGHNYRSDELRVDPFDLWFEQHFAPQSTVSDSSNMDPKATIEARAKKRISTGRDLITSRGLVQALAQFYQNDLSELIGDYERICSLDPILLGGLGVSTEALAKGLKLKIEGLKHVYWRELFGNFRPVTSRLATKTRQRVIDKLQASMSIDFMPENVHALCAWLIKNCNQYFDDQLIELVERLTKKANVIAYKSNQKTFTEEGWRYGRTPEIDRYKLDYRIILECWKALDYGYFGDKSPTLNSTVADLLNDFMTIANNLGFVTRDEISAERQAWEAGQNVLFYFTDQKTGQRSVAFEAKAYKKGTIHLKVNQRLMCRLNVEFGRLKGWVRNAHEAAEEMDISVVQAQAAFNANLRLGQDALLALSAPAD